MSTLVLVRHAQASFVGEDYDKLSPKGEEQARRLGDYWTQQRLMFDGVYTGPRIRQCRTAEIIGECFATAGQAWPELVELPEFDEHSVERFVKEHIEEFTGQFPQIAEQASALANATSPSDRQRRFQLLFEALAVLWMEDKCSAPDVESWPMFRKRVCSGIERITDARGRGRRVAVFTSAGVISVALQSALSCTDRIALEVG